MNINLARNSSRNIFCNTQISTNVGRRQIIKRNAADPPVLGVYEAFAVADSHVIREIIIVDFHPVKVERVWAVGFTHCTALGIDGSCNDLWVNTTYQWRTCKSESKTRKLIGLLFLEFLTTHKIIGS